MEKAVIPRKLGEFEIAENRPIARDVMRMHLAGDARAFTAPGQFAFVALDGFYLRRPFSVFDWDDTGFTMIYKVVGEGTGAMRGYLPGRRLSALTGLGNGFDGAKSGLSPALIGGGVGVPPLYALAKALLARDIHPTVVLGFNAAADAICVDDFGALGLPVSVATVDGSLGAKGFVTDALGEHDYFFACGPEPMLRAVSRVSPVNGQLSFEERMACGIGACMGCSCQTMLGPKRVCKDGPVFEKGDVLWQS